MIKQPRVKDADHLDFVRSLPCVCCGNNIETEAAHLRSGNLYYGKRPTGGAEKPSDKWTLPLCGNCHREQHTMTEAGFWIARGIEPYVLAMSLYMNSGHFEIAIDVIERQRGAQ